jgi:hypothetical protein
MNRKRLLIIIGIIFLIGLVVYVAFNPNWIKHPRYMINSQYCQVDTDCKESDSCGKAVNIYNFVDYPLCAVKTCGSRCENNLCILNNNCGEILN